MRNQLASQMKNLYDKFMSNQKRIHADFVAEHSQFTTPSGDTYEFKESSGPYEYLLGALSGCLFITFRGIATKMKVNWTHISLDIEGVKREEVPTWLKECTVAATVTGSDDNEKFTKCFEKATRYCSVYQTLSQVAQMHWKVQFN
ncbi:MAG: OsmC family protein [Sphaerochaetaceae bacterium]